MKAFKKLISVLLTGALMTGIAGCAKMEKKLVDFPEKKPVLPKTGIVRLNFVPAIGHYKVNQRTDYCFYIDCEGYWDKYRAPDVSFMVSDDYDYSLLASESAFEFIKEVESIEDRSIPGAPFAYKIDMEYKDNDGTRHTVLKKGYGQLPSNWLKIIKLANDLTMGKMEIPSSSKITVVDGNYFLEYHRIQEHNYPRGVSLDDILKELKIDYEYLYDATTRYDTHHDSAEYLIDKYSFEYLKMKDYSYFEDTKAVTSTPEELKAYAEKHLKNITSINETSAVGSFKDKIFEIVRTDHFEDWRREHGAEIGQYKYDQSINLRVYDEGMKNQPTYAGRILECWLDPSHKFVIILDDTMNMNTGMRNYNLVYDFFKQQVD